MDKQLIADTASCMRLLDIYQYSASIKRYVDLQADDIPENMYQQGRRSFKAELLETESKSNAPDLIKVLVSLGERFVLQIEDDADKKSEEEDDKPLAHFEADFVALYEVKEELEEHALEQFIKFNVLHNVWPFWREFVFRSADSMHLPKPDIPLMNGMVLEKKDK